MEQILRLCRDVDPSSVPDPTVINFDQLDKIISQVEGLYGDKCLIEKVLQERNLLVGSISATMPAGLYAVLADPAAKLVYLVFWPEATSFEAPDRGNIAANFMRYLYELSSFIKCLARPEASHMLQTFIDTIGRRITLRKQLCLKTVPTRR
eukprot:gnl/Hemi2/6412_TR2195_c0_g1_i1.p1 gnl/Hemi2/6412_TR2195_c0_g1~~gnl/Hemi2/6412_TR2195_c0_g1_i1.p1  ORF type:complete len:151 (-),score=24.00 gnl/Hemi2/6412_TR2195_c0_g1_i1:10-462(-)